MSWRKTKVLCSQVPWGMRAHFCKTCAVMTDTRRQETPETPLSFKQMKHLKKRSTARVSEKNKAGFMFVSTWAKKKERSCFLCDFPAFCLFRCNKLFGDNTKSTLVFTRGLKSSGSVRFFWENTSRILFPKLQLASPFSVPWEKEIFAVFAEQHFQLWQHFSENVCACVPIC